MGKLNSHSRKPKILWISWHWNPYNDYLFNELSGLFDLDVVYIKEVLQSHPWDKNSKQLYKSYDINGFTNLLKSIKKVLSPHSIRIVAGWNHPFMLFTFILMIVTGRRFIVWTDTPNIYKKRNFIKEYVRKFFLHILFSFSNKVMSTGKIGVLRLLQMGVSKSKVINFPFATDINFFRPNYSSKLENDEIIFISSGRLLNYHKGFNLAISAFSFINQNNPQLKFKYFIAGSGEDEILLKEQIQKEKLENKVYLVGWIQTNDLLNFYHSADIFIHPSHFDPYPNVVLEAMACGLPIIGSSSAGSVVDRVNHGINGYIFNDNDVNELVEILSVFFNSDVNIKDMKIAARKTAENWTVSYNINQIQNILVGVKD